MLTSGRLAGAVLAAALALLSAAGCGRLSGGGGGGTLVPDGPVIPPSDDISLGPLTGLVSAVGGPGQVRVEWFAEPGTRVAVFGSTDPDTVFDGLPLLADVPGTSAVLEALTDDTVYTFGLGVDDSVPPDPAVFRPTEAVLTVRTGAPLYVDAAAPAEGADGLTPQTAFPALLSALLTSFVQGGRNIWVAGGDYAGVALPVFAGTHVAGGFDPAVFDLATRDRTQFGTRLEGAGGQPMMSVQGGTATVVLDGLELDGRQLVSTAIEVIDTPFEMRGVQVHACTSTGVKLRAPETGDALAAALTACELTGNGGEGLDGRGALRFEALGCLFASNTQEGVGFSALVAPNGRTASAHLVGSRFRGNGTDGADIDLAAPLFGGLQGGDFDVRVERCVFELNGVVGLLLDIDYELHPEWSASLLVRGCVSRANLGDGVHIDADGQSDVFVHRLLSTGNAGHGLRLTSEIFPAVATLSASALVGNGGAGARSLDGNATLLVSHCIVAGNTGGGVVGSAAPPAVHSSLAYLQPQPWVGADVHRNTVIDDGSSPAFLLAPVAYDRLQGSSPTTVTLSAVDPNLAGGSVVELADDGVARTVVSVNGLLLALDPMPDLVLAPALLGRFDPGLPVTENYRLAPGSPAEGGGLVPPGGPPADAGVFGAPLAGPPGTEQLPLTELFFATAFNPPLPDGIGPLTSLRVRFFPAPPDPASVSSATVSAEHEGGQAVVTNAFVDGLELVIDPPASGWPAGTTHVKLHPGLSCANGQALSAPLVLPVTAP